jgi:hypothetical protein
MDDETNLHVEPDELRTGGDVEILRCARAGETRAYTLRVVPGGVELWRITEGPDGEIESVKESLFKGSEETSQFLEELRRALIAGGWREA